jgi:hypothetical protein
MTFARHHFDLIGDIHGHYDKLVAILQRLGYRLRGGAYCHSERRTVIFLGDYIDRGPNVHDVLSTIRNMVDAGSALAVMGNHEYNAICYHTPDDKGDWLRPHRPDRDLGLRATLRQFVGYDREWHEWIQWMRQLPLFLDLGRLRAVHACWDAKNIDLLHGLTLADDATLAATSDKNSPLSKAAQWVLKGPEMQLPQGFVYHDKEGFPQNKVRVRWWDIPESTSAGGIAMPVSFDGTADADAAELRSLPDYPLEAPPVFFGHYWLPANQPKRPLRHNIACLDFSVGRGGPLVAYRWNGEHRLSASRFVSS